MQLWLKPSHFEALIAHARAEAPREACGVLLGTGEEVREVVALANVSPTPEARYIIEPKTFVQAIGDGRKRGLELIGLYHSHPDSAALPSERDIAEAQYPDTPYVIISLQGAQAEVTAWHIRYGAVTPVELHVSERRPCRTAEAALSRAQQVAIVVTAVVAALLLLLIAFSLLPAPPPILSG